MLYNINKIKSELDGFLSGDSHVAVAYKISLISIAELIKDHNPVILYALPECRHLQEQHTKKFLNSSAIDGCDFCSIISDKKFKNENNVYIIPGIENWIHTEFITINDLIYLNDTLRDSGIYIIIPIFSMKFIHMLDEKIPIIRDLPTSSISSFMIKLKLDIEDILFLYSTAAHHLELFNQFRSIVQDTTIYGRFISSTPTKDDIMIYNKYIFGTNEPIISLSCNFKEYRIYLSIMYAIATGHNILPDIANHLKIKETTLYKYINELSEYNFIEEIRAFGKDRSGRKRRYRIVDNYYDFWFRFIYENNYVYNSEELYTKDYTQNGREYLIKRHIRQYCIEKIEERLGERDLDFEYWWDNDSEIPIVYKDEVNETIYWGAYFFENIDISHLEAMQDIIYRMKRYRRYINKFFLFTTEKSSTALTALAGDAKNNVYIQSIGLFSLTRKEVNKLDNESLIIPVRKKNFQKNF